MSRRSRRATLHAIRWYPQTRVGPCHRGGLIVQRQMNGWVERREYVVHSLSTGRLGIEHEWSMK